MRHSAETIAVNTTRNVSFHLHQGGNKFVTIIFLFAC